MTQILRKLYTAFLLLLMGISSNVQGNDGDDSFYAVENGNNYCAPLECCAPTGRCGNWMVRADLLYLRACEGGFDQDCGPVEITDRFSSDDSVTSVIKNKRAHLNFKWDPGFRVGLGYDSAASCYNAGAYWTHFDTHAHNERDQNHVDWNLNYDVVDAVISREFCRESCLSWTPFAGLRGAWVNQKLKKKYVSHLNSCHGCNCSSSSSSSEERVKTHKEDKQDFYGYGPQIGLAANWRMECGFSLYGSIDTALLFGDFNIKSHVKEINSSTTTYCEDKDKHCACQAAVDAAVGLQWIKCICEKTYLELKLGLEHHRIFDYNQFGGYGDLCLDGATFSAAFHF